MWYHFLKFHMLLNLAFDTETSAVGSMRRPVTQVLMQLAWVISDASGNVVREENHFVTGATQVGPFAPHGITVDYVNRHGSCPREIIAKFMADAVRVAASGGRVVAHNLDFDVGVLEYAGAVFPSGVMDACLCTMKQRAVIRFCKLSTSRGRPKYPKLSELYSAVHGKAPDGTLHDALFDANVLRKSYHRLLELGVIQPRTPPRRVLPSALKCDLFIDAGAVGTIMGLSDSGHPYTEVERVLSRYGEDLGVGSVPPAFCDDQREELEARRREREMHAVVDAREDISSEVASEAKRLITAKLRGVDAADTPDKPVHRLRGGSVDGTVWGLSGEADGEDHMSHEVILEGGLGATPLEYVQLELYMRLTNLPTAATRRVMVRGRAKFDLAYAHPVTWDDIKKECAQFCSKLNKLVRTREVFDKWVAGGGDARRAIWNELESSL